MACISSRARRSLIHRLSQRSRAAVKAGAAVVRRRDAVRARGQRRSCELCHASAQTHRLQGRRAIVEGHVPGDGAADCGVTLAVKVTDCPKFDGFSDEAKAVVVVALFTTWLTVFDLLGAKFKSPPYTALIAVVLAMSAEVVKLAEPPLNVPVPNTFVPFTNVTVPPSDGAPT